MEKIKVSLEKIRKDPLSYCLEFLKPYELISLLEIKNKYLQQVLIKKVPSTYLSIKKNFKRERQPCDYPPICVEKHKKNIHYFCSNCNSFICDICHKNTLTNASKDNILCQSKLHHGSKKVFDKNCEKCNAIYCIKCCSEYKNGNIVKIENMKQFCKEKESENLHKLKSQKNYFLSLLNNVDSIFLEIESNLNQKFNEKLVLNYSLQKSELISEIEKLLEMILYFINYKVYDNDSLKKLNFDIDVHKKKITYSLTTEIKVSKYGNNKFLSSCNVCNNTKNSSSHLVCDRCQSTHVKFIRDWSGGAWSGDPGTNEYKCLHCDYSFIVNE